MLSTLLFFLCQGFTIYNGLPRFRKDASEMNLKKTMPILISFLLAALFEESFFRVVYKQYFGTSDLARLFNGLLFGVVHSTNFFYVEYGSDLIIHMFNSAYLGWYIFPFDNFLICFAIHGYFNLINLIIVIVIGKYFGPQPVINSVPKLVINNNCRIIPLIHRSLDDSNLRRDRFKYKYLPYSQFNSKVIDLHERFDYFSLKLFNRFENLTPRDQKLSDKKLL